MIKVAYEIQVATIVAADLKFSSWIGDCRKIFQFPVAIWGNTFYIF
jgi:hypothetical protein